MNILGLQVPVCNVVFVKVFKGLSNGTCLNIFAPKISENCLERCVIA